MKWLLVDTKKQEVVYEDDNRSLVEAEWKNKYEETVQERKPDPSRFMIVYNMYEAMKD